VLNADFRPLSYYPAVAVALAEVIKAVFLDRVDVVSEYDHVVHSPSFEMKLPSVVSAEALRGPGPAAGVHAVQPVPARQLHLPVLRRGRGADFDHIIPGRAEAEPPGRTS
jgi:hypothetical protein